MSKMLKTKCKLKSSHDDPVILYAGSIDLYKALKAIQKNISKTNPVWTEFSHRLQELETSIQEDTDFDIKNDRDGIIGSAMFQLFDNELAEMEWNGQFFSRKNIEKEYWREGKGRGSCGGFLYKTGEGEIIFKTISWTS